MQQLVYGSGWNPGGIRTAAVVGPMHYSQIGHTLESVDESKWT